MKINEGGREIFNLRINQWPTRLKFMWMSHGLISHSPVVPLNNTESLNLKWTILVTFLSLSMFITKFTASHLELCDSYSELPYEEKRALTIKYLALCSFYIYMCIFLPLKETMFHLNKSIGVSNKEYIIWLQRSCMKKPNRMSDIYPSKKERISF